MSMIAGSIVEFEGKERTPLMGVVLSVSAKGVRVLLLNRKETTITERSILHSGGPSRVGVSNLDSASEGAQRIDQKRSEMAVGIDLAGLHSLLAEDQRPYRLGELAGFLANPADDDFEAALLRRLYSDPWYFKARKEGWTPVPIEEAEAALAREKKRLEQEREDDELIAALKQAPRPGQPLPANVGAIADHLIKAAVFGSEAPIPKKIWEILDRAGIGQDRKLVAYLVRIGLFKPDENLLLRKYRIPVEFPEDAIAAASEIAAQRVEMTGRHDRRGIPTWAIDSESTRDRDDAFSISPDKDGGLILEVHIADPASVIGSDSSLEREACRRGATIYLPEGNIPMLPPSLSEEALGLNQDVDRRALTVRMHFGPGGETISSNIEETLLRVTTATDYLSADRMLAEGDEELSSAVRLARMLRDRRRQNGAILFERQPERKISLDGDLVKLGWRPSDSPTQDMVAEFMIWANHTAAAWCRGREIACLYRIQDAPDAQLNVPETFEPVA
ncbi:MAG TPA: ribonuclease catalytic domain-containing protein, partial [Candidatus Ozemobacteraceae bacterium]|nr:ribonuclease catalytic domain-containing protein [Candidatus Ozemobacteraceae bacterium]